MPSPTPLTTTNIPPPPLTTSTLKASSTSPTQSPSPRTRRLSRFTEGSETTRPEIAIQSPSTNELFFTILSEMDAHEEKRRQRSRGGSNSSVESFVSSAGNGSPTMPSSKEGRRSVTFGRGEESVGVRRSLDILGRELEREGGLASMVKGRLRALTGERRRDVKPYPGT